MWTRLSLRARISALLCAMFLCAALLGLGLLRGFAAQQLRDENEAAANAVSAMATALNAALQESSNPEQILRAFVAALPDAEHGAIVFIPAEGARPAPKDVAPSTRRVPAWFVRFLDLPRTGVQHPILIDGGNVGELAFEPSMEADLYEKWVGFLVIVIAATSLALMTIAITYITVGKALRPLRELDRRLARLREGDYSTAVSNGGPPEVRGSLIAANDLASTLGAYDAENQALLRKMVAVQDEERRDLARELHDELGPLLFAIRANATALTDAVPGDSLAHPFSGLTASVEELQLTSRRILERLRPDHIDALGLRKSLEAVIDRAERASGLKVTLAMDDVIERADPVVVQTLYRVVQESLTNVLRHAEARQAAVAISVADGWARVTVDDDGIGLPAGAVPSRGINGMRERSRALGGTLEIEGRAAGGTRVRCALPVGAA